MRRAVGFYAGAVPLLALAILLPAQKPTKPAKPSGELLFRKSCASCHGEAGKGGPGYAKPLAGSLSVSELSKFIHKTMPPGPKKCPAPEAGVIAQYMYDAFYSPLAQERNRPARVAMSRLTVRQFRNAVADLLGESRPVVPSGEQKGLRGEYFTGREMNNGSRKLERVDPVVKFDFGTVGPTEKDFDQRNFSGVWTGSVLAPDTGEYEFVIRSDQSVRMWVNGYKDLLIDAWIKSGKDTEFRGSINLIGGRAYPVRLEFSKASVGVDDTKDKVKRPPQHASVELLWRRPKMAIETVPTRCLYPEVVPESYVVANPFPPDDRSIGYERGAGVSKEWDEATTTAALEAARVSSIKAAGSDKNQIRASLAEFLARAFRRPLTKEQEQIYLDRQLAATPDLALAVKRVVLLALKSPRFLYREVGGGDSYATASALSFGLWDTVPDAELRRAAAAGELKTRDQIRAQAERMVQDPRAWNKLREFLLQWLKVDEVPEITKSSKRYPEFGPEVVTDLRTSLELFLREVAWGPNSDYRELFLSKSQYMNGRLAKMYGLDLAPDAPFQPLQLDPEVRSGLLTQPYLLSRLAYLDGTSPIHRGVLIVRSLLGRTLNPPPAAFTPLPASLHPSFTTRQRVELQTKPTMCNNCHGIINPLGFTLERFDAIGRLRATDNGKAVDTTGSYVSRRGEKVTFAGATDLGKYIAGSADGHEAFVGKLFQHLVKQPPMAYGAGTLAKLDKAFIAGRFSIRSLMVQVMLESATPR